MRRYAGHGALLAPAMIAGSAFGYVFAVIAARILAPGGFGALGSALSLLLILAVPGIALQTVAARRLATADSDDEAAAHWAAARVRSRHLAIGLLVLVVLLARPLTALLELPGLVVVGLALSVVGQPMAAVAHGSLQGRELMPQLAGFLVASGVVKFVLAGTAVLEGGGVSGAVLGLGAAECVNAVVGRWLVGRHVDAGVDADDVPTAREIAAAGAAVAGILVLTNADVLLARHYLSAADSGLYAAGATFARVLFWAPQFVSVLVYPRLAAGAGRRTIDVSTGVVIAISGTIVGAAVLAGPAVTTLVFGQDYAALGARLWIFALLGSALAVLQLLTLAQVARDDRRIGWLLAVTVAADIGFIVAIAHGSITAIVGASATFTVILLLATMARARRRVTA
ncbi:MAG: oligosaccharide flippase family protein [Nitriliruptorales bacterium]|nr:oligosaccharide flippase family protein [Nitriliruptorales bacterium]